MENISVVPLHFTYEELDKMLLIFCVTSVPAYSDNKIEGVATRSILYLSARALDYPAHNQSRGMVIAQLLRFLGFQPEHLRPDAPSYIQPTRYAYGARTLLTIIVSDHLYSWPFKRNRQVGCSVRNETVSMVVQIVSLLRKSAVRMHKWEKISDRIINGALRNVQI